MMRLFSRWPTLLAALAMLSPASCLQAAGPVPGGWDQVQGKRVLYFTKSSGFEHSVVKRPAPDVLSHSEKVLTELGKKHGFDVVCTKDGTVFTPENLAKFDAIVFFTSGNLLQAGTDKTPPMTPEGKAALLDAIKGGKGFVGLHSSTDSFHYTPAEPLRAHGDKVDPYIAMLGAEFIRHGPQQTARLRLVDSRFPGVQGLKDLELHDEWYTFKDFAPDLHVIQVLQTQGMKGVDYQRAPIPYTWARKHGQGRVYYNGLAHREDVWLNPKFQAMLLGGLGWAAGNVPADVPPNLKTAAPGHAEIQPAK